MENKVLDLTHELTSNNLVDVIAWLKEGAYVIIHNAFDRVVIFILNVVQKKAN